MAVLADRHPALQRHGTGEVERRGAATGGLLRAEKASKRASELNPHFARAEANLSLDRYSAARYDELVGDRTMRTMAE